MKVYSRFEEHMKIDISPEFQWAGVEYAREKNHNVTWKYVWDNRIMYMEANKCNMKRTNLLATGLETVWARF